MKKKVKNKKVLSMLVALSLMAGGTVSAERDHQIISYDGHPVFDLLYFDTNDKYTWVEKFWEEKGTNTLCYDFDKDMKSWLEDSCRQWAEILKPGLGSIKKPAQLVIGNSNQVNAGAKADDIHKDRPNYFKNVLTVGTDLPYIDFTSKEAYEARGYDGFALIDIGMGVGINDGTGIYGWSGSSKSQHTHGATADLTSVMFHELAHAMGIYCLTLDKSKDDPVIGHTTGAYFGTSVYDPLDFVSHLVDENGNPAQAGQVIVSPYVKNMDKKIYTDEQMAYINSHPEKYFQLSKLNRYELDPNSRIGRAFFVGENVKDALGGVKFWGIDGIPINGFEGELESNYFPELSHIELERSIMSHQEYRSYNTFMEAELALMQDIGYKIDRKNFYGKSIYGNGLTVKNTQGFFARNDAGTAYIQGQPNTSTMGVGLHIYGSNNTITQTSNGANDGSADLLACGTGAAGIRVDGVNNDVTLAKDASIVANGQNGNGILLAYGRDHKIKVDGNVTALGEGGDAIRFDFGRGMAQTMEIRGSYTRYQIDTNVSGDTVKFDDDMTVKDGKNINLTEHIEAASFSDHNEGDLGSQMATLDVSGTVAGKSHAIYMDQTAFVDNININDGAKIIGDITSDWKNYSDELYGQKKSADSKLKIQYKVGGVDKSHYYDEYCKDLVTNLNINGDFKYGGNITGSQNMKLKVKSGANMEYTGNADVVGVQVEEGASLYGGNYKVNEVKKYASFESLDEEAGKLINHGNIGALTNDSNMNIDGNLENYGTIDGRTGGDKGIITVSGKAVMKPGSKVDAIFGLPGETLNVLKAEKGIDGPENVTGGTRGLLNYEVSYSDNGTSLNVEARAKESLEGATPQQAADYTFLNDNAFDYSIEHPATENEFRNFYALEGDSNALKGLEEMRSYDREEPVTAVLSAQTSTINQKILSSRLATALGQSPAMMHIGASQLENGEDKGVDVPVKLSKEQDKSAWVKFSRNWSKTAAGSGYTGNIITMGYDWKHGDHQRNGVFGSYTDGSFGHNYGNEKLQDTRLGYYTGIHKGADTKLLYADLGYLRGNRSRYAYMPTVGTKNSVRSDYTGWLAEIGGEWKHDLHKVGEKTWQVSPYGSFQMSYMKQHGYRESDSSIKANDVSGGHNFYAALEGGFEFSRYMPKGSFNFRLGLRHALTGTGYESHEFNDFWDRSYTKSSRMDKTHLVTSMAVETEIAPLWQLGAELTFQKGAHDRDIMATLQIRRMW